jgi:hypothetical protein
MQELLTQPVLQKLAAKTVRIQHWQCLLDNHLDAALAPHCKVADFSTGILTLVIDSSAFATRLRYLQHTLLDLLRKHNEFNGIYKIDWVIAPISEPLLIPADPRKLSQASAQLLVDTAATCESEELKEVLLRLAARADK